MPQSHSPLTHPMYLLRPFITRCIRIPSFRNVKFLQTQYGTVCRPFYNDCINRLHPSVISKCEIVCTKSTKLRNVLGASTFTSSNSHQNCSCFLARHSHTLALSSNQTMGKRNRNKQLHKNDPAAKGGPVQEADSKIQRPRKLQPLLKVPTKINLVVIGTGGPGTSQSLLVTTEYSRYMFNCGEGTQRFAAMNKGLRAAAYAKIAGLEHIFITHKSWENTGGLLGMALTLEGQKNPDAKMYTKKFSAGQASENNPQITIHGPPGVENIAMMAKKFAVQANMRIVKQEGEFNDTALIITPIPIYKNEASSSSDVINPDVCAPGPAKRQRRETDPRGNVAYAYLCKAHPLPPKINVAKCVDAGVTMGPMVGRLQKGESVTLEDGRVVHPEQVTDVHVTDGRPFLVIECPSKEFLPSLLRCSELEPYVGSSEKTLAVIVHMTPDNVFNMTDYQSWIKGFHESTDHLVMNREAGEVHMIRVNDHQARLNLVSQEVFPLFPWVEESKPSFVEAGGGATETLPDDTEAPQDYRARILEKKGQMVKACSGLHYVYRGKNDVGFHVEAEEFKCKDIQDECLAISDFQNDLATLRNVVPASVDEAEVDCDEENHMSYPKITFLGTGSSEPNAVRAQSCVLVQLSKHSAIILDCGEDSYGQLYRFFGKAKASRILRKVKAIFISHLHADHHLGLYTLLKERKIAFDEKNEPFTPAFINVPVQMKRWLRFYHTELEPVTHLFRIVRHQQSLKDYKDDIPLETGTFEDIKEELNLTEYKPIEVDHCHNAYGIVFTHGNGFKLVYSGDTRPCDKLVTAGDSCDLLIHEATHEDLLYDNAVQTKHSTFSEAINVGLKMNAKNIILTHFSQRYVYMAPLNNVKLPPNVGVAFDNMQICPRTMKHLPHMIPALTSLFAYEMQKLDSKIVRRLREEAEAKAKK